MVYVRWYEIIIVPYESLFLRNKLLKTISQIVVKLIFFVEIIVVCVRRSSTKWILFGNWFDKSNWIQNALWLFGNFGPFPPSAWSRQVLIKVFIGCYYAKNIFEKKNFLSVNISHSYKSKCVRVSSLNVSYRNDNNFYLRNIYYYAKCQALSYAIKCRRSSFGIIAIIPENENKICKKKFFRLNLDSFSKTKILCKWSHYNAE